MKPPHRIVVREGIDDARFGMTPAQLKVLGFDEKIERFNNITQWRAFTRDGNLMLYVKDYAVVAFACFESCALLGQGVIGLSESEIIALLGHPTEIGEPLWVDEDIQQTPFEYEALGLQVWIEKGRAISVFGNDGSE